jgi:glutamyl-tRNA synthetase
VNRRRNAGGRNLRKPAEFLNGLVMVVTRFAPSPTGFLHIGGARTALFNWLYARHHGGQFLLRIEDTDRKRSTDEAIDAIKDGLAWLGLDWDGEAVSQFARRDRHAEIANQLLAEGKAYKCFCTPEELAEMREAARKEGRAALYDGRWRDRDPAEAPPGIDPVIRIKAPQTGETVVEDLIQGTVTVANETIDDMVLLRSDGTPTYMLAVVVDDHDMEITHAIRGDDHFTNTFRQLQIYQALGWTPPAFAHIPLIHGPDGAKLSKRHGALAVGAYRDMGYLPEALRNYLLRLGWSHGDDEIISTEDAVRWFDLDAVGKSPARFDFDKLNHLNAHYLRQMDDSQLVDLVRPRLAERLGDRLSEAADSRLSAGMTALKERANTIEELTENAQFYAIKRPIVVAEQATKALDADGRALLHAMRPVLGDLPDWSEAALEELLRQAAADRGVKLGKIAQPLRSALTGSTASPGLFEVMTVLGRDECVGRIDDVLQGTD